MMDSIALRRSLPLPPRDALVGAAIELAERGWLPDALIRVGIRSFVRARLEEQRQGGSSATALAERLKSMPIAVEAATANQQHYEVPPEFFELVLGRRLKYSCGYWPAGTTTLDGAEEAMLALTAERAGVEDGMDVLDLGCGWGSFALWLAERQPRTRVVAASNSAAQGRFIAARAAASGLTNVEVVTADINSLMFPERYDRVVSVEMFEHARNYQRLLGRIRAWLRPHGQLFVHIFCHRDHAYLYDTEGASNWMARHFFTGGTMPSANLLAHFQDDLMLDTSWWLDGTHYARTAEAWLANLDRTRSQVEALFRRSRPDDQVAGSVQRWRLFFLGCAEMLAFSAGSEWGVGHYRFVRRH
jgi:cyclopropane-fatty-acyl-phospholipid synthase